MRTFQVLNAFFIFYFLLSYSVEISVVLVNIFFHTSDLRHTQSNVTKDTVIVQVE
jgi:hypothetical protein